MSLMSEVSVSSDSLALVLAALVLPGFFTGGFLEEDTDALFFEVTLCFETCLTSSKSLTLSKRRLLSSRRLMTALRRW